MNEKSLRIRGEKKTPKNGGRVKRDFVKLNTDGNPCLEKTSLCLGSTGILHLCVQQELELLLRKQQRFGEPDFIF